MTEPFCFVSKIYILPCFINIITNNEAQMQRGLHVLGTADLDMIFHSVDMPSAFFSVQWVNEKILKIHLFTVLPVQTRKENDVKFALFYKDLHESVVLDIVMHRHVSFAFGQRMDNVWTPDFLFCTELVNCFILYLNKSDCF